MPIDIYALEQFGEMETWFSIESDFVDENEQLHIFLVNQSHSGTLKAQGIYKFVVAVLRQLNDYTAEFWDDFAQPDDRVILIQVQGYELKMTLCLVKKLQNRSLSQGNRIFEFRLNLDHRIAGSKEQVLGKADVIFRGIFQVGKVKTFHSKGITYNKYVLGIFDKADSKQKRWLDKTDAWAEKMDNCIGIQEAIQEVDEYA